MAFLLSSFFIVSTFSFIHSSSVPPLLSLSCIPSPAVNINPIETLVYNLTVETPKSYYTTSNTTFGPGRYTGLMQCRLGLSPRNCAICADIANVTILSLCRNSIGVSAWFDGCYLQISSINYSGNVYTSISNHSCSGHDDVQDLAQFLPALGTLFFMLRADVNIPTHRGFSHREIGYENVYSRESRIYGLVECGRSLSLQECDSCIAEATEKLLFYCGGKNGGVLVYGACLVRFDSSEFYHEDLSSEGGGASVAGNFSVEEDESGWSEKKLVMVYWSGGVGCFVLVVYLAWLLRITVLKRSEVGISDFDQETGKSKTAD